MDNSNTIDEEILHLRAERAFLIRMLAKTPPNARLTRMSEEARLRKVEAELILLIESEQRLAMKRLFANRPKTGATEDFDFPAPNDIT